MASLCVLQFLFAFIVVVFSTTTRTTVMAFTTVETTGRYVTGVRDFDLVDSVYPSNLHPHDTANGGRRIMFRLYYPVCQKVHLVVEDTFDDTTNTTTQTTSCRGTVDLGARRAYLQPNEWQAYFGIDEPIPITQSFDLTQSYENAPLDDVSLVENATTTTFPMVIYAHGYGSFVSDNTVLLEEIASHGYLVAAVASPGFAGGVVYPTGDVVTARQDYPEIQTMLAVDIVPNPYLANYTDNLDERYYRMEMYLSQAKMPMLVERVTNDVRAVADYLDVTSKRLPQDPTATTKTATTMTTTQENNALDPILMDILGFRPNGLDQQIVYMGFSLGGSAAGSAAHADNRAVGAINLDGAHQSLDLWNTEIRVPYLMVFEQTDLAWFYHGEFLFENLVTMGTRTDIYRVLGPQDVVHNDYTDQKLFSQALRTGLLGRPASVDGLRLHQILSEFCLSFVNTYLRDNDDQPWDVARSFDMFDGEIEPIDVSYVAEWAEERFATDMPTNDDSSAFTSSLSAWTMLLLFSLTTGVFHQW